MRPTDRALQANLPLLPEDAEIVGPKLALSRRDGELTFFSASGPIYHFSEDDQLAARMAAVTMCEAELAGPCAIAAALGIHRSRLYEWRQKYRQDGAAGLTPVRRGPKGPYKVRGSVAAQAQEYLNQGLFIRAVGRKLNLSEGAIRVALKQGRLVMPDRSCADGVMDLVSSSGNTEPSSPQGIPELVSVATRVEEPGLDELMSRPRARSDEDGSCAGGVAVKRNTERALACFGKLVEAKPQFSAAETVAKAGVLVALPALLGQGLLDVGEKVYGSLRNGYFGLSSVLLTFAWMALLRIKTIENLPSYSPGEFGLLLGLDRAPEIKTARRKLKELADRQLAAEFAGELARGWAEEDPEALGYLYVDGHVRPYHGRRHILPKTLVQRRRLCMPATTDYWVNDANADPLLVVTAAANDGLLGMLDREVLGEIRELVGEERRFTLIFDREGWSPNRFERWSKEERIDVITYRRGRYEPWPEECFSEELGRAATYRLGERTVQMRKGFWMREVRRLCDSGHQTAVMTTRQDIPILEVAERMFSRWSQENFFRYMRHEFDLDHLPTNAVELADAERTVPNPERKAKKKELAREHAKLAQAQQEYGQEAINNKESKRPTMRGFKIVQSDLGKTIRNLEQRCLELTTQLRNLPERVPLHQLLPADQVVELEQERKRLTDCIKMVAYRAETQLANLVGPLLSGREDEARKFLKDVFELPADLIPEENRGRLLVRLHGMANWRSNRVLAGLCGVLNDMEVCYPATTLRLVFEAPDVPEISTQCPGL